MLYFDVAHGRYSPFLTNICNQCSKVVQLSHSLSVMIDKVSDENKLCSIDYMVYSAGMIMKFMMT